MKILFASSLSPFPTLTGIQQRMAITLEALAEIGTVTVMTGADDEDTVLTRDSGLVERGPLVLVPWSADRLSSARRGLGERLTSHLLDGRPAMVRALTTSAWPSALAGAAVASYDLVWLQGLALYGLLRHQALRRVVVDLPDAESLKRWRDLRGRHPDLRWLLDGLDYLKVCHAERRWRRSGHWFVVCSEHDRRRLGRGAERTRVVRNAVALPPVLADEPSSPPTLIFVGTLAYAPNRDAVRFFIEAILPRIVRSIPDARFHVVGAHPPPEILALAQPPHISIFGSVAEVAPFLQRATACVVPLRNGAGTRLKILEAMSYGKPVVSTAVGAEGLDVNPEQNILIADEPAMFADRCVALLRDLHLRRRLGRAGRHFVSQHHHRDHAKQDLCDLLDAVQGFEAVGRATEVCDRAS